MNLMPEEEIVTHPDLMLDLLVELNELDLLEFIETLACFIQLC